MVSTAKLGVVKQSFFWSPGTIWPPCDKGELPNLNFLLSVVSAAELYVRTLCPNIDTVDTHFIIGMLINTFHAERLWVVEKLLQ